MEKERKINEIFVCRNSSLVSEQLLIIIKLTNIIRKFNNLKLRKTRNKDEIKLNAIV